VTAPADERRLHRTGGLPAQNGYPADLASGRSTMDIGRLAARIVIGGLFIGHGTQKLLIMGDV
jgi:hypothetical protein